MRNYNPIISEFVNQNNQLFGGFPIINAFSIQKLTNKIISYSGTY